MANARVGDMFTSVNDHLKGGGGALLVVGQ